MKMSLGERSFSVINYIFLALFALLTFYPFYVIVLYSLSDPTLVINNAPLLIPRGFTFVNYVEIFTKNDVSHPAFISFLRTVIGTITSVAACSTFAYGLTKKQLPFRKFIYRSTVMTMYISAGLIPGYVTLTALGLKNTFLVYILPGMVSVFHVILIKVFIEQLPAELEESAKIDGAGYFRIFFQIIVPVIIPIMVTVAIFTAVGQWNSWVDNLYYCTDRKLLTLQLMLYNFIQSQQFSMRDYINMQGNQDLMKITPQSVRMTITVVVVLPVFCVYPFMQKYFIKGLMVGAIKG